MRHQSFGNWVRKTLANSALVLLLTACGGGVGEVVALLQIVTPLNGSWAGFSFGPWFYSQDDYLFVSKQDVRVVVREVGVCGATATREAATEGVVDNGKLSLHLPGETTPCLTGTFVDLRRLDLTPAGSPQTISAFNFTVDVLMSKGLWSSDDGTISLKFRGPSNVDNNTISEVTGCDVSNPAAKANFSGRLYGFNTTTLARPKIPELRDTGNALLFSQVEYVDGATITMLDSTLKPVTLRRKRDPVDTACPA